MNHNRTNQTRIVWWVKDEVLDLYVLWVEAQVLQYGLQDNTEPLVPGTNQGAAVDSTASDANWLPSRVAHNGIQVDSEPPTGPLEEATPASTPPHVGDEPWDDLAEGPEFDPRMFWMLLEQAGYELW